MTPKHISYSQLRMFKQCPLQWQKTYELKEGKYQANIYGTFGEAVHQCIQYHINNNELYQDNFLDFLRQVYHDNKVKDNTLQISDIELKNWAKIGAEHVKYYINHDLFNDYTLIQTEFKLDTYIPINQNIKFTGFIDLLLLSKDEKTIKLVDFKTSSKGWTKKNLHDNYTQLHLYAQFLRYQTNTIKPLKTCFVIFNRKFPKKIVVSILNNDNNKNITAEHELNVMIRQVFDDNGNYRGNQLPARPSKDTCRFCQFRQDCNYSYFTNENKENIYYY